MENVRDRTQQVLKKLTLIRKFRGHRIRLFIKQNIRLTVEEKAEDMSMRTYIERPIYDNIPLIFVAAQFAEIMHIEK